MTKTLQKLQCPADTEESTAFLSKVICIIKVSGHPHMTSTRHTQFFFNSLRDTQQIEYRGQLNKDVFQKDCYRDSVTEPHGHLLFDWDQKTVYAFVQTL